MNERLRELLGRLRPHLPSRRQAMRSLPLVVPLLVLSGFMLRNLDLPNFPHYEVPDGFVPDPPPSTAPPGGVVLPDLGPVRGTTTTTLPANVGTSHLSGSVVGPAGPIPGAVVRVERAILGQVQAVDVGTGADGRWDLPGIGGGRYRVRAFLPPTLAQRTAEVFFLRRGEERSVDLTVEQFAEPSIVAAVAPSPPILDQSLNLVIQVTGRFVDENGFVRIQPLVSGSVEVLVSGPWARTTVDGPLLTDGNGRAIVTYHCESTAEAFVQVTVQPSPDLPPTIAQFGFPACIDPATTTTTTDPSSTSTTSTEPPSSTTSTTSSTTTTTT